MSKSLAKNEFQVPTKFPEVPNQHHNDKKGKVLPPILPLRTQCLFDLKAPVNADKFLSIELCHRSRNDQCFCLILLKQFSSFIQDVQMGTFLYAE